MVDVHSHILPNIDDGSQSMEESIQMIKEAYNAGFTDIISTSHYMEDNFTTNIKQREELIKKLEQELLNQNINVKIYNGAEAYISINIIDLIKEKQIPTLNNTNYVLIELPMNSQIIYLDEIISRLITEGLIPIIAHPERYSYFSKIFKTLQKYIEKGVLLQSNYGSIIGVYGKEAQKNIKKLLKKDMVHFLGTDVHRKNSIYTKMDEINKKLEKLIGEEKLKQISYDNPKKILQRI